MTTSGGHDVDPAWGYTSTGESRWPGAIAVLVILALQLALPDAVTLGPIWALPAIEAGLLVALVVVGPTQLDRESRDFRVVAIAQIVVMILAVASTLALLVHRLLDDNTTIDGRTLIISAATTWCTTIVAFGLAYWEMDRGGPIARCSDDHPAPDFLFPQMSSPTSVGRPWTPRLVDYAYLAFTNSTAFSPTDTMPLTVRAKAVMAAQSTLSLVTVVIVGARAVNILR